MIKLIAGILLTAFVSFAQGFHPQIQTHGIWLKYQAFLKANTGEKVVCTGAPNTRSPQLNDLCLYVYSLISPNQAQVPFAYYVVNKADPLDPLNKSSILSFLSKAAESRIDSQNGGPSSSGGTTSVVERSGISDVLGAALESGAVTQSVSGSTLTLQGNALSIERFVTGQDVFQYCSYDQPDCDGKFAAFLNKLSGSASLGLSNASTQTVAGTVAMSGAQGASGGTGAAGGAQTSASALIQDSASHLTGLTVRYQAINQLDLRSQAYLDAFAAAFSDPTLQKAADTANQSPDFSWFDPARDPDRDWLLNKAAPSIIGMVTASRSESDLEKKFAAEVPKQWDSQLDRWKTKGLTVDDLKKFLQAINAYMLARDAALNAARQKLANGLTFEYDYSRPSNQPRISTARVIYTFHPGTISADTSTTAQPGAKAAQAGAPAANKPATTSATPSKTVNDSAVTFNFAADLYDSPPPGTNALRDLQAAVQLDHHFGNTIATLAGYYQYQHSPAALTIGAGNLAPGTNIVLNGTAATLLAPKGNIVVAQAMVTFPLKSGTKLPVSVTWSNRTDLLKGNELRGHVGFNFDWSSLLLGSQAKVANPSQQ
jgi:hypothetical protein